MWVVTWKSGVQSVHFESGLFEAALRQFLNIRAEFPSKDVSLTWCI